MVITFGMLFEAGLFYTLLGIALVILLFKIPYREFLFFLSAAIFISLAFAIFTGNDIGFYEFTNDGVNPINQTSYIIGTQNDDYNVNGMWLAFILGILGVIIALIGLAMWVNPPKQI